MSKTNVKTAWRKPTKVECIQFTGDNFDDLKQFCSDSVSFISSQTLTIVSVKTLQGCVMVNKGDYVLKGEDFYPIREDLFHKLYTLENQEK